LLERCEKYTFPTQKQFEDKSHVKNTWIIADKVMMDVYEHYGLAGESYQ